MRELCDEVVDEVHIKSTQWSCLYKGGLHLDELHDDVILHIALFLDARVIRHALSKVCVRFQQMFDNELYWKTRIYLRCHKQYPAVPVDEFCWSDACLEREDSYRVWGNWQENTHHFLYGHNVHGEVDAVHLMNEGRLMVSGDRNRFLNLVDLTKWQEPQEGQETQKLAHMLVHTDSSHAGWIWSMASVGNTLITGSWDTQIRLFDVAAGCVNLHKFKCDSAVLSIYAEENEIVASCFREVAFVDFRTPKQRKYLFHTKPVLCVVGNDRYIVTGSEDKTMVVYDRRAEKPLKKMTLDAYPLCMNYRGNQLWYGDRQGQLHLLDATGGAFSTVATYDVSHTDKVTGMVSTDGAK